MDRIKEQLDQLSELSDDQVAELQSEIVSEFETVESQDPTPQTVDAMTSLADMLDTVRSEVKRREVLAAELAQRAAEAANRVHGQDGDTEDGEVSGEDEIVPLPEDDGEAVTQMMEEEEKPVPADEAPAEEAPVEEVVEVEVEEEKPETPASESEEDEDEDKKMEMSTMSEASADAEKTVELSTETATEAAAEETVVAAAEEAVETATPEAELSAEESVVVEEAVTAAAEETTAVEANADAEASVQEETTETESQTMEAPVTAAADNADNLDIEVPADRRPVSQATAAPVAITAGADIPGYTAGSPLDDMNAVAEAMAKRLHALRRVNGGDGEQHIVASLTTSFPEERTLGTDPEENWNKIQNVVGPEALVASGGHQAPFEVRYDIFGFGTTNRPVRDALPTNLSASLVWAQLANIVALNSIKVK